MSNSKSVSESLLRGDIAETEVMLALWRQGRTVLKPARPSCRYDLAIDDAGKLIRIQCKNGKYHPVAGVIKFNTCSLNNVSHERKSYKNQVDLFGVYCPQLDKVYLVPVNDVGISVAYLRVDLPKLKSKATKWAKDYEIT